MSIQRKTRVESGQTIVEFALVIILFLLLITFVIEAGRIIWAYGVVQRAAREGARYAITGESDPDACTLGDPLCNSRTQSIIDVSTDALAGLRINDDENALFQDDYFTLVQVFGYNGAIQGDSRLQEGYGGDPGQPVVVRVSYNVPVVTPLLRPVVENVPVFGQVTLNNELFGQTGGTTEGIAVPPPLPAVPKPGPTDTPTPTSTPTPIPTIPPGSTNTPTITSTPPPRCNIRIQNQPLIEGATEIIITGDLYRNNDATQGFYTFDLIDVTNGRTIAENIVMQAIPPEEVNLWDHGCANGNEGLVRVNLNIAGEGDYINGVKLFTLVLADHQNGTQDQEFVQADPNRASPTPLPPTQTAIPSDTPQPTPTFTETPDRPDAFITFLNGEECVTLSPSARFEIIGGNWVAGATIRFEWQGLVLPNTATADAQGRIPVTTFDLQSTNGRKFMRAFDLDNGDEFTLVIDIPCPNDIPTATPTPSPTFAPPDLVITTPELLTTGPINEFEQVEFRFTISNIGETDASQLFFVDLYLDPDASAFITTTNPILQTSIETDPHSDGFVAVAALGAQSSEVLTITSKLTGFKNDANGDRSAWGMVDSLDSVNESREDNNISSLKGIKVTPGVSPTPTPALGGSNIIGGIVSALYTTFVPQQRATVYLIETVNGTSREVGRTITNNSGGYIFSDVPSLPSPSDTYTIVACLNVSGSGSYVGFRDAVPSDTGPVIKNIFMVIDETGCPYSR